MYGDKVVPSSMPTLTLNSKVSRPFFRAGTLFVSATSLWTFEVYGEEGGGKWLLIALNYSMNQPR